MTDRWWDQYNEEAPVVDEFRPSALTAQCAKCEWTGVPIDHPRMSHLLCARCLANIPGTSRALNLPSCPECASTRLTPDGKACLTCNWPEKEIESEPTTENPEDLE